MKKFKPAAFGVRAHSGWAAVVIIAGSLDAPEIIYRSRIGLIDLKAPSTGFDGNGPAQPYHIAREFSLDKAKNYLSILSKSSCRVAMVALEEAAGIVGERGFRIKGCGIVLASGRELPALEQILASHLMIHTAEGEFFRNAICEACIQMGIKVTRVKERELISLASEKSGLTPERIKSQMEKLGHSMGSPWTADQKNASVAGFLAIV